MVRRFEEWRPVLLGLASATGEQPQRRAEAILALGFCPARNQESVMAGWLGAQEPVDIQQAAAQVLASSDQHTAQAALWGSWPVLTPRVRGVAIDRLARRPEGMQMLLDGLDSGIIGRNHLSPAQQERLTKSDDFGARQRAVRVFGRTPSSERRAQFERLSAQVFSLEPDPSRGRLWFIAYCLTCHNRRADTEGLLFRGLNNNVGPDLGRVRTRPKETLLSDIVDPNQSAEPQHLNYIVEIISGQVASGLIAGEDNEVVRLRNGRESRTIQRGDIARLTGIELSLMPEGYETLGPEDLADLVAFLGQQ